MVVMHFYGLLSYIMMTLFINFYDALAYETDLMELNIKLSTWPRMWPDLQYQNNKTNCKKSDDVNIQQRLLFF